MAIHPTAVIDSSAKLGRDVKIDAYAIIGPGVSIGDRTHVQSHAVMEYAEIGADCQIYPFSSIGLPPQHMGYKGEPTKVVIGDRCTVRESVIIHRGTLFDKGVTKIGNDAYLMALCHIAHDCIVGNNVIIANGAQLAGHVQIGDRVFISGLAAFHQYVRVGVGALISGGAMVSLDVAPYCIGQADRVVLRGLNVVGMRRSGLSRENIKNVKAAYKAVFLSALSLADALKHPSLNMTDPYVKTFREFLSVPKRGFARPMLHVDSAKTEEEDVIA